MERRDYYDN